MQGTTAAQTFENGTEQWPVSELWVDTVGVRSVEIDWQAAWREGEGWQSFEAPSCPDCGSYGRWDAETREWRCPSDPQDCEKGGGELDPYEEGNEGPMMNYYYPLPDLRRVGDDPNEAADRIRDLPLCVVRFDDGGFALALTGGGMDLSWEIAEAFTRLGFLPPLHFCDLPRLAGKQVVGDTAYTLEACKRSCEVAAYQAASALERLQTIEVGGRL